MVHIVLPVVIMWRGVDEPTPKISFLFSQKKKKNLYSWISFQRQGVPYMSAFISFTDYGITPQIIYVHDMTFHAKKKKGGHLRVHVLTFGGPSEEMLNIECICN